MDRRRAAKLAVGSELLSFLFGRLDGPLGLLDPLFAVVGFAFFVLAFDYPRSALGYPVRREQRRLALAATLTFACALAAMFLVIEVYETYRPGQKQDALRLGLISATSLPVGLGLFLSRYLVYATRSASSFLDSLLPDARVAYWRGVARICALSAILGVSLYAGGGYVITIVAIALSFRRTAEADFWKRFTASVQGSRDSLFAAAVAKGDSHLGYFHLITLGSAFILVAMNVTVTTWSIRELLFIVGGLALSLIAVIGVRLGLHGVWSLTSFTAYLVLNLSWTLTTGEAAPLARWTSDALAASCCDQPLPQMLDWLNRDWIAAQIRSYSARFAESLLSAVTFIVALLSGAMIAASRARQSGDTALIALWERRTRSLDKCFTITYMSYSAWLIAWPIYEVWGALPTSVVVLVLALLCVAQLWLLDWMDRRRRQHEVEGADHAL